jgi:hypothetical protein
MATIIGIESLTMAFFGLPNSVCTPFVIGRADDGGCCVLFMIKKRIRSPLYLSDLTRVENYDTSESKRLRFVGIDDSAIQDVFHFFLINFCYVGDAADV